MKGCWFKKILFFPVCVSGIVSTFGQGTSLSYKGVQFSYVYDNADFFGIGPLLTYCPGYDHKIRYVLTTDYRVLIPLDKNSCEGHQLRLDLMPWTRTGLAGIFPGFGTSIRYIRHVNIAVGFHAGFSLLH